MIFLTSLCFSTTDNHGLSLIHYSRERTRRWLPIIGWKFIVITGFLIYPPAARNFSPVAQSRSFFQNNSAVRKIPSIFQKVVHAGCFKGGRWKAALSIALLPEGLAFFLRACALRRFVITKKNRDFCLVRAITIPSSALQVSHVENFVSYRSRAYKKKSLIIYSVRIRRGNWGVTWVCVCVWSLTPDTYRRECVSLISNNNNNNNVRLSRSRYVAQSIRARCYK